MHRRVCVCVCAGPWQSKNAPRSLLTHRFVRSTVWRCSRRHPAVTTAESSITEIREQRGPLAVRHTESEAYRGGAARVLLCYRRVCVESACVTRVRPLLWQRLCASVRSGGVLHDTPEKSRTTCCVHCHLHLQPFQRLLNTPQTRVLKNACMQ